MFGSFGDALACNYSSAVLGISAAKHLSVALLLSGKGQSRGIGQLTESVS